jgi:hypothetical protein
MTLRLSRALVQYYVALRLSAAAATERWPLEPKPAPPAVMRLAQVELDDDFDPRERFSSSTMQGVVTLPAGRAGIPAIHGFSLN